MVHMPLQAEAICSKHTLRLQINATWCRTQLHHNMESTHVHAVVPRRAESFGTYIRLDLQAITRAPKDHTSIRILHYKPYFLVSPVYWALEPECQIIMVVPYCTILYCTIFYYTILYYSILDYVYVVFWAPTGDLPAVSFQNQRGHQRIASTRRGGQSEK